MNETLDSVESSQGGDDAPRIVVPEESSPPVKRSSVVDIWRQREAKGEALSDTDDRPKPPIRKQQSSQRGSVPLARIEPAEQQQDAGELIPRMARKSSRGIASASPAPPPLPVRRAVEPDITIVPSPSNQSATSSRSAGSAASRRSTRVLQAWERQTKEQGDLGTTEPTSRLEVSVDERPEPTIITESPSRRSVVDIWNNKTTSPKTSKSWIKSSPPLPKSPKASMIPKPPVSEPTESPSVPKWRAALKKTTTPPTEPASKHEIETSSFEQSTNRWNQPKKVEPSVPQWKARLKPVSKPQPASPRWKPPAKMRSSPIAKEQRSTFVEEKQQRQSSPTQKEQQQSPTVARELHRSSPVAKKPTEASDNESAQHHDTPVKKGSVLDRWKVAQSPSPPVVPHWKKKTKPPVEHVVVQDEPTASETEMPSDDELVDFTPQETMETPKKPGKITDRWMQAKGVSAAPKPPVWAKPNLKPVKSIAKVPKDKTVEASTTEENDAPPVEEHKSGAYSPPLQSPWVEEKGDEVVDTERHTVPNSIECESAQVQKTPSPLKIAPPSPILSKLVKEFGHRTPIAGLRKVDRIVSYEEKKMEDLSDSAAETMGIGSVATAHPNNSPETPTEIHTVTDEVSGVVKNRGFETPPGKKRLSIADRWTAKVSASKTNSASKEDVKNDEQPTDEEKETTKEVQHPAGDFADHAGNIQGDEPNLHEANAETALSDAVATPTSVRSGVADRWKKRVATAKEKTPEIIPQSPKDLDPVDIPSQSSPMISTREAKSPVGLALSPRNLLPESPINDLAASGMRSGQEKVSESSNSSLLQKLSFGSDAQSNENTSDVEVVLNASSEASKSLLQTQDDQKLQKQKEDTESSTITAKPSIVGRRGRQLSRNSYLKSSSRPVESKSEVGKPGLYPDFQKLVDRSRNASSSLSPTRDSVTNCLPHSKSKEGIVTTPPRFQKSLRSLSAPRPKSSKVSDVTSTSSTDASPIDMITAWNQKLNSSTTSNTQTASVPKTIFSPPRYKKKVRNEQGLSSHQRNRKNFAQLGRKHASKRPQNADSHDEDSLEDELSETPVQNEQALPPVQAEQLSPAKYAIREAESKGPLDPRRHSSTPVMSNRRSKSSDRRKNDKFECEPEVKRSETSASTRKLAAEKSSIKKKLNSRRKSRDNRGTTSGARTQAAASNNGFYETTSSSFDQDHSYDHGEDYDAILLPDSGTPSSLARDQDFDRALETATSSASSPSSLANKAERVLQERRRKSQDHEVGRAVEPQGISHKDDMEEFANRVREGIPTHGRETVVARRQNSRVPDDSSALGVRSLSSRYNVSSRFMEQDGRESLASESMQGALSNDEESSLMMSAASTNASPPLAPGSRKLKQEATPKQRRARSKPSDSSVASSVNTANLSAWDASRVSDIASLMSFDLKKFASAVDERVAVLRDFVGGPTDEGEAQRRQELDMEMEDVAIEVEYVEEDGEDLSNSPSDFGLVSSQSGDELMKKGYV